MLTPEMTRVDVRLKRALRGRTLPRELCISGPAGTGKTYSILTFLHLLLCSYPGLRFLIVRKTRKSLTETTLVTYEQGVLAADSMERLAIGCRRSQRHSYRYPNGSELVVGGLDDPEKIKSSDWDIIYPNEATELSEHDWEYLSSRLDRPGRWRRLGYLIGDCNPDAPYHWLKLRAESGKTPMWCTTHEANPVMYDGRDWTPSGKWYIARLEGLTGVRYLRLRKGLWAGAEGLVYDEWDESVHVIDPFPIPAAWPRIRSIDFGFVNAFVCQFWAIDHDGRAYLYRELYGTKRLVADWAERIKRLSEGEDIALTVADHDAEDRATLHRAGIHTIPARKEVLPGIEAVQRRLRKQDDGKPRLFVFRNCLVEPDPLLVEEHRPTCLASEIGGYAWAKPQEGRPAKEEPAKINDHAMDACRYAIRLIDQRYTNGVEDPKIVAARELEAERKRQAQWHRPDNPAFWE